MRAEKEVKEFFERLGLQNESDRIKILSQGDMRTRKEQKPVCYVTSDDITTT